MSGDKEKRIQKTVYWEADVYDALEKHMRREKITNFSIAANDAVRFGIFPEYRDERNAELFKLYSALSFGLAEHRKKTARDLAILQELILQLIKVVYTYAPHLPEREKMASEKQAESRLDKLMEAVIRSLPKKTSDLQP